MTKNQKALLALLILLIIGFVFFLIYRPDNKSTNPLSTIYHSFPYTQISDFYPSNHGDQLIEYTNINIAYDNEHEQALWVCYLLTKDHLNNAVIKRKNRFKIDAKVKYGSASPNDYYKSGFDRGHLAPAADMLWSEIAMKESFYMSNISPQKKGFNRGVWKKLEGKVRKLTLVEDSIVIITGPLLTNILGSIGSNNVSVPSMYYKVIVDISAPKIGAVAFLIPNRNTKLSLDKFALSVDSLEKVIQLDFMASLPDDIESQLEKNIDYSLLNYVIQ
ncbi:MAG: DNA/RNA non-specific endonuclease [Bacteroidales bacterium]|nr:DNA/RNA non-specific endonuclease [Bacteroidales bacterium]